MSLRKIAQQRLANCVGSNPSAPSKLADLMSRWGQVPPPLTASRFERNPDLEETVVQLVYDTETATATVCGSPTGDDGSLLRIAQNPNAVEQE